ncbi:unnamed protein product [Protopolystoma xenopodis]|uniref:Uncharacterized protein n=1 Tax=Protopolystoma xenopodis TaxID=117903 RepID=A0A3S5ACF6_9PLAT|nr:unnamed protein product [Protopolystoma xenopodis]
MLLVGSIRHQMDRNLFVSFLPITLDSDVDNFAAENLLSHEESTTPTRASSPTTKLGSSTVKLAPTPASQDTSTSTSSSSIAPTAKMSSGESIPVGSGDEIIVASYSAAHPRALTPSGSSGSSSKGLAGKLFPNMLRRMSRRNNSSRSETQKDKPT